MTNSQTSRSVLVQALNYKTPVELFKAFKSGVKFKLHYHGREFEVTHMEPREKVVYVQPPGMPVKVYPDGRSAEGGIGEPTIWLTHSEVAQSNPSEAETKA